MTVLPSSLSLSLSVPRSVPYLGKLAQMHNAGMYLSKCLPVRYASADHVLVQLGCMTESLLSYSSTSCVEVAMHTF